MGNSLGLRLPPPLAAQLGLRVGSEVTIAIEKGRITLTPCPRPHMTLEKVLEGLPADSRMAGVDWGTPVGREEW